MPVRDARNGAVGTPTISLSSIRSPPTAPADRDMELHEMQHKQHPADSASRPPEHDRGPPAPGATGRAHHRPHFGSKPPALQIRRILVLANRFQAMCALKSDPQRLVDLLRTLLSCCRETFGGETGRRSKGPATGRPSAEQAQCMKDLEVLLQGLIRGYPEASRGLAHAMDGLLIQCVVFDATAGQDDGADTPSMD